MGCKHEAVQDLGTHFRCLDECGEVLNSVKGHTIHCTESRYQEMIQTAGITAAIILDLKSNIAEFKVALDELTGILS